MKDFHRLTLVPRVPLLSQKLQRAKLLSVVSITNLLILIWIIVVYWHERTIYVRAVNGCRWEKWEDWPSFASPHHVALIADPQLVDPHTYPGRPWPLSTITVKYADIYLRRVYRLVQRTLYPDTTIFLGDLFDGGREWATPHSQSPEMRYKRYGDGFWHKEYKRFASIFLDSWLEAGVAGRTGQPERRQILSNLPGNHDLGFASGIQEPVRNRFNAYFGDGSSINIIGNHTFVSLDTVSLSAKEDEGALERLWKPAQDFLDDFTETLKRAVVNYDATQQHKHGSPTYRHEVIQTHDLNSATLPKNSLRSPHLYPTILLTHVPLYRVPGTPCGPLRERWPQSKDESGRPLDVDERNAIAVRRGYQYQNVLSDAISEEIANKLENISYAFSGDDHDYCEVIHHRYKSAGRGIKEVTVKSLSWAMGVRKPGFQLVSLWKPTDIKSGVYDSTSPSSSAVATLQTSLCLLPDQLGIFFTYAKLLVLTLLLLCVRAAYLMANPRMSRMYSDLEPILPLNRLSDSTATEKAQSSSSDDGTEGLTARSRLNVKPDPLRGRSLSPKPSSGYGLPAYELKSSIASFREKADPIHLPILANTSVCTASFKYEPRGNRQSGFWLFRTEFRQSVLRIALIVFPWYAWLLYLG